MLKRSLLFVSLMVLALAPAFTQPAQVTPSRPFTIHDGVAIMLNDAEAERAELALKSDPEDVQIRAGLITYYFRSMTRKPPNEDMLKSRRAHILWLAEHHPETAILGKAEGCIERRGDANANLEDATTLGAIWRKEAARKEASPAVLANTAYFFRLMDREFGASLLERAILAEPLKASHSEKLGLLLAEAALGVTEEYYSNVLLSDDPNAAQSKFAKLTFSKLNTSTDAALLRRAASYLTVYGPRNKGIRLDFQPKLFAEKLLLRAREGNPKDDATLAALAQHYGSRARNEKDSSEKLQLSRKWLDVLTARLPLHSLAYARSIILGEMAKAAFQTGDAKAASDYAGQLRTMAQESLGKNNGDAVHNGNTILGLVAIGQGDTEAAARYLLASGQTNGSPVLGSFGPSMALAQALLQRGQREPVIEYLKLCSGFWKIHQDKPVEWIKEVQAGRIPDFGFNLIQ